MSDPNSDLYPIHLLMDELKSEDVVLRLSSIRRLSTIALALGPSRTREELIPFIQYQLDDEDEVLLVLAEELGNFVEYVGGKEYAHVILGPLENLTAVEETLVREKAAESISKISVLLSAQDLEQYFLPIVKRLATGEWFTSRTSACALFATPYPNASSSSQEEMRKLFGALCHDDTPMVRRAAAKALGPLVKVVSETSGQHDIIVSELIPMYRKLAGDDQDSVRLLTIPDLIALAAALSDEETKINLLEPMRASITDKSWRVRYMVANEFVGLAESTGESIIREELVGAFVGLLKDNEAEVRTAASGQVPGFAKLVDKEVILARLLPCVRDLSIDSSQHVRAALAMEISGLAPLLGKDATIEHLLPLFLQLLKDEFSDVRLNLIGKLDMVNEVIGIDRLSQALLPAIMTLAEDKQWRVRQAIIEYIPLLAQQLGVEFFDDKLGSLCMSWLGDTVFSIREAATINLKKLTDVFGVEWAKTTIIPKVLEMGNHQNYLYRMTTIFAITTMAPSLNTAIIQDTVLDAALNLANDAIPNIRFNVAKCLETLASVLAQTPEGQELVHRRVVPALRKLQEDQDADVRYFATKAYERTTGDDVRGAEPMILS
ncbi:protein phosphatase 2 (formerly 2A), regulatory subunit A [Cryptococcus deuterogattii 99/473]|uniref:Protein phosphatase 2 (Formerly 2A), regulatory subunit A n=2 Tax=Cryptococcus deuterogattii TaxID=1859096 RepID=A0A0D0UXB9_9TREE|nr:protein phosphatase 2 (formerly 2A) regulatory subunit A [Cryptococcus deuterogattii R265]KIR25335.1 protein phosphatase 2 (formerly 2A), regulatory subunit A [Cryptococcus deuterogattii LA55]KIR31469.1 protein phosphatase 2 (formerly 2A), regulatory subunit A [Cryptococcus deuterogattii MMRL2647]KIR38799.1 protein phosphatase 2 (formerly 2A), regulatory subunit A [Cryptococcus deuterogattii Ram5]KIR70983.1 protein phosphatase 2 (formerly 2A), regulatory subunit A [Cryptococcus deuterogattii